MSSMDIESLKVGENKSTKGVALGCCAVMIIYFYLQNRMKN